MNGLALQAIHTHIRTHAIVVGDSSLCFICVRHCGPHNLRTRKTASLHNFGYLFNRLLRWNCVDSSKSVAIVYYSHAAICLDWLTTHDRQTIDNFMCKNGRTASKESRQQSQRQIHAITQMRACRELYISISVRCLSSITETPCDGRSAAYKCQVG